MLRVCLSLPLPTLTAELCWKGNFSKFLQRLHHLILKSGRLFTWLWMVEQRTTPLWLVSVYCIPQGCWGKIKVENYVILNDNHNFSPEHCYFGSTHYSVILKIPTTTLFPDMSGYGTFFRGYLWAANSPGMPFSRRDTIYPSSTYECCICSHLIENPRISKTANTDVCPFWELHNLKYCNNSN